MNTNYGEVEYKGEIIILDEAACRTSRLMSEYGNDLQYQGDGDTYMDEWAARGHTESGKKVRVYWHFEIEKEDRAGDRQHDGVYFYDTPHEDYDWENVHDVKSDE